ncbi:hypothetical protein [Nonomuraea sp. NPDC048826]|uniref:hypothetical protein n=1 Tax=Nonomuraea sp. NPDC048826 TaxID=3364347 RepID=UPI0037200CB7
MTAWTLVRDRIIGRDARGLADLVITLSDADRAEVARNLPALRKELRETAQRRAWEGWSPDPDEWDEDAPDPEPWDGGDIGRPPGSWDGGDVGRRPGSWDGGDVGRRPESWGGTGDGAGDGVGGYGEMLRIAGAGVLGGPAAAAGWLTRREFAGPRARLGELLRVLAARPETWQADVATRLARKIRTADDRNAPLALAVLRACGTPPPDHDPLVTAWLRARPVADDPLIGPLLPRIFEAEGVGRLLREERLEPVPTRWLSTIGELMAAGRVSRAEVLDGCLRRFLRGGDAIGLRFFVRLHRMLDPTPQEAADRVRDYLRLLPVAPGPVAELALAQLRHAGLLDPADTVEAIEALTFRPEAKLALEGLRRLERHLTPTRPSQSHRRSGPGHPAETPQPPGAVGPAGVPPQPGSAAGLSLSGEVAFAGEFASALAAAFGHASYEVQGRAARIALKYADALAPAAGTLADGVPLLPAALGAKVAAVYGGEVAAGEEPGVFTAPPPSLPEPPAPEPFPEPTLDVADSVYRWVDGERWLAALVRQAAVDPEKLRAGHVSPQVYGHEEWVDVSQWIAALAEAAAEHAGSERAGHGGAGHGGAGHGGAESERAGSVRAGSERAEPWAADLWAAAGAWTGGRDDEHGGGLERAFGRLLDAAWKEAGRLLGLDAPDGRRSVTRPYLPRPETLPPPHLFLLRRLDELHRALRAGTLPPVLLATPTLMTGHLDPAVLVERVAECAATGVEPLPADLVQALLRLPRGRHPEAAEGAARIGSAAALTVARWLADGGLPDPETGVRWSYLEGATTYLFDEREPAHRPYDIRLEPVLRPAPTGLDVLDELLGEQARWRWGHHDHGIHWWPALLPSHREVVAADFLPYLFTSSGPRVSMDTLVDADGPAGEATALTLAVHVARAQPEAASLLVRMAARGDLPAEEVGAQLALLLRRTPYVQVRPLVGVLGEAARQGAYAAVWRIMANLLPALLPDPGERPGVAHTEAVTLAADVAAWAGARGAIPEVSAYATGGGRSRFVRECARLHNQLG